MIKNLFTPEQPIILKQYEVKNGKWHVHGKKFEEMSYEEKKTLERAVRLQPEF
jgi:hypothetical protein